jgi:hypothetical protein
MRRRGVYKITRIISRKKAADFEILSIKSH